MKRVYPVWTCAECGIQKTSTRYLRQHDHCSRACANIVRSRAMRAERNPNYTGGPKLRRQRTSRNARVTTQDVRVIIDWAVARSKLGTAASLARRLGISVSAVHMYAPCRLTGERDDQHDQI